MKRQRAEEIAASPEMAHVIYHGERIYIQHVHEQKEMARVYPLHDPAKEFDVPLEQLEEREQ